MRAAAPRVGVVVAATDARSVAPGGLARFAEEVRGRGEVVVVDGSVGGAVESGTPGLRVVRGRPGALAPELWRDGLRVTDAPRIAFSSAAMVPSAGWLDALLARLDGPGVAAVGGPIAPASGLGPTDRALYLLRYGNYMPPLDDRAVPGPAGDNALYRRERLAGLDHSIAGGFWEAEIHRVLRARGELLATAGAAVVTYHGGERLGDALARRFRHARRYGASRAGAMPAAERLARLAGAPAVPAVLARRAVAALGSRGVSVRPWLAAAPGFALLAAAWSAGEATGVLAGSGSGGHERPASRRAVGRRWAAEGQGGEA